ncbi:MAG TPA: hypothetical protein VHS34_00600 [Terriglobales bacterium]|nr:hypothetical protein [Terriglobales bacterium]
MIQQQQQRVAQYQQRLDQQQRFAQQRTAALQQQRRMAQYRFQQQYYERERDQEMRLRREHHDYNHDPYFYTAPIYRYNRGGAYYETNQYGADLLRQAVNYGYQEGFRAGAADREDHWRPDYQDSFAYQDANYGYTGYYVDQADYNYYFREGFQRGYEDGYYDRYQYGTYSNGSYSVLGNVLSLILNLQSLH